MAEDFDSELAAAMLGAGGAAGAAGYYGAKAMSQPSSVPMLDVVDESPFIGRDSVEIPDVEGGFGSPEQRRAASEASAGARGVRKAVNPRDLYVPEIALDGSRQPLDYEGRSRFRDYMKNPGMSNPNKGKLFDYVPEGTVSLLEQEEILTRQINQIEGAKSGNIFNTLERSKMDNQLSKLKDRRRSIANVIEEIDHPGRSPFTSRAVVAGQRSTYDRLRDFDPEYRQVTDDVLDLSRNQIPAAAREANFRVTPGVRDLVDRKHSALDRAGAIAGRRSGDLPVELGGFEDEYRKMASDEFGQKIEKGLDNARRYLDESFVARELMTKQPVRDPSPSGLSLSRIKKAGSTAAAVMGAIPDPTDLALLAMAGPLEMMYRTEIGQEPGTGTFGIPLATTLGKASELIERPLSSRDINVPTRIRLAQDDYPLASQLFSDGVLSAEAFDIITRIRQARGGDTTVLPMVEPAAPEPEPAIGLPGRRF